MLAQRSKLARIVPSRSAVKAEEIVRGDVASRRACLPGKLRLFRPPRDNSGKIQGEKEGERGQNLPVLRERLIANQ